MAERGASSKVLGSCRKTAADSGLHPTYQIENLTWLGMQKKCACFGVVFFFIQLLATWKVFSAKRSA